MMAQNPASSPTQSLLTLVGNKKKLEWTRPVGLRDRKFSLRREFFSCFYVISLGTFSTQTPCLWLLFFRCFFDNHLLRVFLYQPALVISSSTDTYTILFGHGSKQSSSRHQLFASASRTHKKSFADSFAEAKQPKQHIVYLYF